MGLMKRLAASLENLKELSKNTSPPNQGQENPDLGLGNQDTEKKDLVQAQLELMAMELKALAFKVVWYENYLNNQGDLDGIPDCNKALEKSGLEWRMH